MITRWPSSSQVCVPPSQGSRYVSLLVLQMHPTRHILLTNDFSSMRPIRPHSSYNGTRSKQRWPSSALKPSNVRTPQRTQSSPSSARTQTRRRAPPNYSSPSSRSPSAAPATNSPSRRTPSARARPSSSTPRVSPGARSMRRRRCSVSLSARAPARRRRLCASAR